MGGLLSSRRHGTEVGLHTLDSLLKRFFWTFKTCLVSGGDLYCGDEIDFLAPMNSAEMTFMQFEASCSRAILFCFSRSIM